VTPRGSCTHSHRTFFFFDPFQFFFFFPNRLFFFDGRVNALRRVLGLAGVGRGGQELVGPLVALQGFLRVDVGRQLRLSPAKVSMTS
jgi:hypothetical protein